MAQHDERSHLLRVCRAAMPDVAGVVLASVGGRVLAHEAPVRDAASLARRAADQRRASLATNPDAGGSALVAGDDGLYLVMFLAPPGRGSA